MRISPVWCILLAVVLLGLCRPAVGAGQHDITALIHQCASEDPEWQRAAATQLVAQGKEALPAVLRAGQDTDPQIRFWMAWILGQSTDVRAQQALGKLLADADAAVRWQAVRHLGARKDSKELPAIAKLLRDDDPSVRVAAATACGETLAAHPKVPMAAALLEKLGLLLTDPDAAVRGAGAKALGAIKPAPFTTVMKYRHDEQVTVRLAVVWALAEMADDRAITELVSLLKDPDLSIRNETFSACLQIGAPAVPALISALKSSDTDWQQMASSTLQHLPAAATVEPLLVLLRDQDIVLRERAISALTSTDDPNVVPALSEALRDTNLAIREKAVIALGHTRQLAAIDPVSTALADPEPRIWQNALAALQQLAGAHPGAKELQPLVEVLLPRLDAPETWQQMQVTDILGNTRDPRVVEPLSKKYASIPDQNLRYNLISALRQFGDARAVPVLFQAMKEPRWDTREQARVGLSLISAPPLEPWLAAAKDPDSIIRRTAVEGLGRLRDPAVVPILLPIMRQDQDGAVREAAAIALGSAGGAAAMEPLLEALKKQSLPQPVITAAFAKVGKPAVAPLLDLTQHGSTEIIKTWARQSLVATGEAAVEPMIALLKSDDKSSREIAISVLQSIGTPAVPALMTLLRDPEPRTRELATTIFCTVRDPRAVEPLLVCAKTDTILTVRLGAINALGMIGDTRAVPLCIALLEDPEECIRLQAAWALDAIPDPRAFAALVVALEDSSSNVRACAANALGKLRTPKAVPHLITAMKDPEMTVRQQVAWALGETNAPQAVAPLIAATQDSGDWVREAATAALAGFPGKEVSQALATALRDQDEDVRRNALTALRQRKDTATVPAVLEALTTEKVLSNRLQVITTLQEMGDRRAIEPLIDTLADDTASVREQALIALITFSGITYGYDQEQWRAWHKAHP